MVKFSDELEQNYKLGHRHGKAIGFLLGMIITALVFIIGLSIL